ncbi:3-Hydroxy-3-methyl-glutaryl-CoA reductase [Lasiodiplodia theobromae]|uniref:3-Hydroxy-3-methyl-glutaryl-CoA reductase n=1 Tax=Lasiodiplodia theobromae TaxID=45133 RepID=UPI0015C3D478|nr:3-Hydroxy-3-methyl-glutaryl-CoA reductase [Lasiodiplodia theobromae]KAF4544436.1 3-Hydroxy-3-methyl-glutaryl-CoA reductase [Lasiodiplodia theobromae]
MATVTNRTMQSIMARVVIVSFAIHGLSGAQSLILLGFMSLLCAEGVLALAIKAKQANLVRPFVHFARSANLRLSTDAVVAEEVLSAKCTCQASGRDAFGHQYEQSIPKQAPVSFALSQKAPATHEHAVPKHSASHGRNDSDVLDLATQGKIPIHGLEKAVGDHKRAVEIRRVVISQAVVRDAASLAHLPYTDYDFAAVHGRCAENVIGYMPIPVGVAGPLVLNGTTYYVPMATTEGALIASTCRGIKAINGGGGAHAVVTDDGMTRAPCVRFPTVAHAAEAKKYIDSDEGQELLRSAFASTTNHGTLTSVTARLVGSELYLRFKARTGEAMGMNMVGKGVAKALKALQSSSRPEFRAMDLGALSGNMCADKKAAAINWIEGRGKSVCAEVVIPAAVVRKILKCEVRDLVRLNISKNLVGSAMAGVSVGGFNAQAANIVAAVYIATGQDPAQVVGSSNCITLMNETENGHLKASVTMPSVEVGTVGGGTALRPQAAMLEFLGLRDQSVEPGQNTATLASIIAGTVLAGELSLCSALVTQDLIESHMALNRK